MEILVVRHGQTDWNVIGKIQGSVDNDLNENGINQAKETRELLKDEQIDLIISYPLKRDRQTAEIINEGRNIEIITDEGIKERNFGEFEGTSKYNLDNQSFWDYDLNRKFEKAESVSDCFDRVYKFLDKLYEEHNDKRVLLVTHGGASVPIYCYCNVLPEDRTKLIRYGLGNCEVVKYKYNK